MHVVLLLLLGQWILSLGLLSLGRLLDCGVVRPDLHGAALGSAAYGNALSIIWPVLLAEDVLQDGQFVVVDIEQIVFVVFIIVKIDYAKIITRALSV